MAIKELPEEVPEALDGKTPEELWEMVNNGTKKISEEDIYLFLWYKGYAGTLYEQTKLKIQPKKRNKNKKEGKNGEGNKNINNCY